MIDCTDKGFCESKSPEGKCQAKTIGYCPYQNITPDEVVRINQERAGEQTEKDG